MDLSYSSFYREELTNVSFTELKRLLEWLNHKGTTSTIIGGWAVWVYEEGLGSRDIDIVIPNLSLTGEEYRKEYFEKNDYIARSLNYQVKYFEKIIPGTIENIIVDIFDGDKEREEMYDLNVKFHWGWMLEFREQKNIGGLEIFVPKRELLIIIKIIAALSRSKEYDALENARLPAKIWKDYRDIAALSFRKELDKSFLEEYVTKSNLGQYMDDFVSKYRRDAYRDILTDIGLSYEEILPIFKI